MGESTNPQRKRVRILLIERDLTLAELAKKIGKSKTTVAVLEYQAQKTAALQKERGIICKYVFHRNGNPIKDFRYTWKEATKEAKLVGRIPHDFRRSAVRNLVASGVSEKVAMEMTGHKTRSVFDRYHIVTETDIKRASERLSQSMGTILGTILPLQEDEKKLNY